MIDRNANILAGVGGGVFSSRPTPAEDLVDAIGVLNRALAAAKKGGWTVALECDDGVISAALNRTV